MKIEGDEYLCPWIVYNIYITNYLKYYNDGVAKIIMLHFM